MDIARLDGEAFQMLSYASLICSTRRPAWMICYRRREIGLKCSRATVVDNIPFEGIGKGEFFSAGPPKFRRQSRSSTIIEDTEQCDACGPIPVKYYARNTLCRSIFLHGRWQKSW